MIRETNALGTDVVSCIIPVHNGEPYLREALDSVFAQTYRPIEVIVVDDGSTDNTERTVAEYDRQLVYVRQQNAGPASARNHGVRVAQGEFVAFLDADDLWRQDKLELQMRRFQTRRDLDYCVTHCQNFWVPELIQEAETYRNHRISLPMPGYVTGTLTARRAAFDVVGPFNIKLNHGDSTDWFLRASERGLKEELLPDVLMHRRMHPKNRSRIRAQSSRDHYLHLLKETLDRRRNK